MTVSSEIGVSFFFFSSRRRHTRFDCDWSSDVCSSDLPRDLKRRVVRSEEAVVPVYANGAYPLAAKQVQYGFAEAFGTVSAGVELRRLTAGGQSALQAQASRSPVNLQMQALDRKSTRLNSRHS